MLHLRLSTPHSEEDEVGMRLESLEGVHRVLAARSPNQPISILTADVEPGQADELLAVLQDLEIDEQSYVLTRHDVVAPITAVRLRPGTQFAWLEVLGEARAHSRPLGRFLLMMTVAGVIAALGVLESNAVLIVGAMAVSPDLLPVCATCVAIVGRRATLLRRSFVTLSIGLGVTAAAAAILTFLVILAGFVPQSFDVTDSSITSLAAKTDYSTILVAFAAGVAAMISFETRASAAVGVAISVTTIPASAYMGVALGNGQPSDCLAALAVLSINVAVLILSGTLTLLAQTWAGTRSAI